MFCMRKVEKSSVLKYIVAIKRALLQTTLDKIIFKIENIFKKYYNTFVLSLQKINFWRNTYQIIIFSLLSRIFFNNSFFFRRKEFIIRECINRGSISEFRRRDGKEKRGHIETTDQCDRETRACTCARHTSPQPGL